MSFYFIGVVSVRGSLDRETKDSYVVTLVARDNGTPSRQTKSYLYITVLDVNDNAPIIDPKTLQAHILENQPSGTTVIKVKATDRDLGQNAVVEFGMESNDLFSIDSKTGLVKALRPLDREEKDRYVVEIFAKDKGIPQSLKTVANLIITVNDMDDNCPTFVYSIYSESIEENAPYGAFVVTVSATDKDIGVNAQLDYGVVESNDRGAFRIDSVSGNITVSSPTEVDWENNPVKHLVIRAVSPDSPCREAINDTDVGEGGEVEMQNITVANVYITVSDINDNHPVFQNGKEKIIFDDINKVHLIDLIATDLDGGKGGKVWKIVLFVFFFTYKHEINSLYKICGSV